jgi:hypothetical protein
MTIDTPTITALTGLAVVITAPIMLYLQIQSKKQSMSNAVEIEKTAKKVDAVQALGKETHTLVNSNMGTQLLVTSTLAQRVADLTNNPVDALVAKETRQKYDDHQARQATVDNAGKNPQSPNP